MDLAMGESWRVYRQILWKHGRALFSGAATGALGIALSIHPVVVPAWVWFLIAVASAAWLGFVVFHDVRIERDKAVEAIKHLTRTTEIASDIRIEPSPNDGCPLIRLDLLPEGGERINGALLNIIYPTSWTTFEGCTAEGLYRFGGTPIRSDEPLPGDVEAKLLPLEIGLLRPGVTSILHFRVQGEPGRHQLIVRIRGTNLNATHTLYLPPQDPSPAHGVREKIDEMVRRGFDSYKKLDKPMEPIERNEGEVAYPFSPPDWKWETVFDFDREARGVLHDYDPGLLFAYSEGVNAARRKLRRRDRQRENVDAKVPRAEQIKRKFERSHKRPAEELECFVNALVDVKKELK